MPSIDSNEVDLSNVESVRRSEVFPKKCLKIINSKGDFELQESSVNDGNDGSVADERKLCYSNEDTIYCTNYRLIIVYDKPIGFYNIPIRSIDCVDLKEMINLHNKKPPANWFYPFLTGMSPIRIMNQPLKILCFENNAICLAWYRLLSSFIPGPQKLDSLFAFTFNAWSNDDENFSLTFGDNLGLKSLDFYTCAKNAKNFHLKFGKKIPRNFAAKIEFDSLRTCKVEFERLAFDNSKWKIVDLNREYKFCPTYPRYFILPASISDAHIEKMATFRSMKRVPTAVWSQYMCFKISQLRKGFTT
uniref:Myotubularin phosphatase domain-containing protein n=1 Tax=Romanomermis culicivorax TaxID=13658 RepID=A0A915KGM2_ROMCU